MACIQTMIQTVMMMELEVEGRVAGGTRGRGARGLEVERPIGGGIDVRKYMRVRPLGLARSLPNRSFTLVSGSPKGNPHRFAMHCIPTCEAGGDPRSPRHNTRCRGP